VPADHPASRVERPSRRLRPAVLRAVGTAGRPERPEGAHRLIRAVGLPILLGIGAAAAKALIDASVDGDLGYLGFVAAVVVAAWIGGLTGGVVATATSGLFQATLFLEPNSAPASPLTTEPFQLGLFLLDGLLISAVTAGLRAASFREHAARRRNEELLRAERAAGEAAARDRVALEQLQAVTASLSQAATPADVAAAVLDRGLSALGAAAGGVSQLSADGGSLQLIASRGYPSEIVEAGDPYPLSQASHLSDAIHQRRAIFLGDRAAWTAAYPDAPPRPIVAEPHREEALAIVPLLVGERTLGAIVFRFAGARDFGDGTGELIVRLAEDCAEAMDRALAYDAVTRLAVDERRRAAELRAVLEAIGDGLLVADGAGRIDLANDTAVGLMGSRPRHLDDVAAWLGLSTAELSASEGPVSPRAVGLADGRWIDVIAYGVDHDGDPHTASTGSSLIVMLRDVTAERTADQAREAFLGVLSHELRTPITAIYGYAKVLRRPGRGIEVAEMLADIEIESDRLYRIVEDLLALNRVEGGLEIEGEPLLIQHLIGPVLDSESSRWPAIRFVADLPPGLPAVFGEQTYVEQVLRNLVSNAAKYGSVGSTVTVTAQDTDAEVEVRVLDEGVGIDPDEASRLFDLYYRSPKTARQTAGAGIGLFVCRGLVTAMGGRVWARPRPDGGSEFGFSLSRCDDDRVLGEAQAASPGAVSV
jgi:two-component system phosphate regulon sensor histidine kinase PhoR